MGIRQHLTYANVTATVALVLALGAGGAYAVDLIGSEDIRNDSILSEDLRDKRAVQGRDVARDSFGRREVDEGSLVASRIVGLAGSEALDCDLNLTTFTECVVTEVRLARSGRIAVMATGAFYGTGTASATCQVRVDSGPAAISQDPGEVDSVANRTDGFARTFVTPPVGRGRHQVSLACKELDPEATIGTPTITAFALTGR